MPWSITAALSLVWAGVLGWLLLVVSVWLLVWPRGYQFVVEGFLEAFTDMTVLRVIGAMGTGVGLALAWLAFDLN